MENKASPKEKGRGREPLIKKPEAEAKLKGLRAWFFEFIKLLLGVALLPFVYSFSVSFLREFSVVARPLQNSFWAGMITFVILYLFVWEGQPIYVRGHKIMEALFSFFTPLVKVAPFLLPIYTIILFMIYIVASFLPRSSAWHGIFLFLVGASTALHLVLSAKALRSKKTNSLQAGYIFGFSFVYITNALILGLFLNLVLADFSFVNFFNNGWCGGRDIFAAAFKQLFVV